MPDTKLLYLEDSYLKTTNAKVTLVTKVGNQTAVSLNQTIFYPQGGGQPSDQGTILGKSSSLKVTQVNYNKGKPLHLGKIKGSLNKGDTVTLKINWPRRYHNMRLHSAGHILHEVIMNITYGVKPIEGKHGISGKNYLKYKGIIDHTQLDKIQQTTNLIVADNKKITTKLTSLKELKKKASWVPSNLPKNKPLRIIQISGFDPIPDGGTQLKTTAEAGPIHVTDIDYDNGHSIVKYQIADQPLPQKISPEPTKTHSLKNFSSSLKKLRSEFTAALKKATTPSQQEALRLDFLGRRGHINSLTKDLSALPSKDRAAAGQAINSLKNHITTSLDSPPTTDNTKLTTWLDVTIPGDLPPQGHLHPISQAIDEITSIFTKIGFTRVRYPEVDWDWYVFESLNMPPTHPARDEWETFFVNRPAHPKKGAMVLTTHTSNGQVREMERVKNLPAGEAGPPIRMLNIAKCYRRQHDVTHTSMFHQFEGLVIDRNINIGHLKGTLDYFAKKFYGPTAKSRIRPFMFKFTEPSFEVDFSCTHCVGRGCRFCKSGWHEVGGSGMVHPNVLRAGGIDPNKYSGFAFGWGVERVFTLKPGLKLDDIRPFYNSNLEFLKQF